MARREKDERGTKKPRAAVPSGPLAGKTIALAVTGSIAAYKAVVLARLLVQAGARVVPVMTASGARFIGPITLSGICGEAVATDMWDPSFKGEMHVAIAARADAIAIVPATADVIARLANGRADDLVCAVALCARPGTPLVIAPAMHPRMWGHAATQANVARLEGRADVVLVGPVEGPVASGESGLGRMSEPEAIARAIEAALAPRDLDGVRILVSAGPTYEDVDPVRYLANRSSGKMGFAIAECAAARGARVTLVAGPVERATPHGVTRVDVRSAEEMRAALRDALGKDLGGADALVMAAAVADYRPAEISATKVKKSGERASLALARNPDILAEIGAARGGRGRPVLVGFALETKSGDELVAYARGKLASKRCDLVVANEAREALGTDENRATIVSARGADALAAMPKKELADAILDRVKARLAGSASRVRTPGRG